jgi:pimeloyl-ACP methyl ester carboxylesterase
LPKTAEEFQAWRQNRLAELRRIVFRSLPEQLEPKAGLDLGREPQSGSVATAPGITAYWKYFPASTSKADGKRWLVVLGPDESLEAKPEWLARVANEDAVLLVAPRGTGPSRWQDPAPYAIERSLALLGRTVDSGRLEDVLVVAAQAMGGNSSAKWTIAGSGQAGVIAAYAALFDPRLAETVVVNPPASHRDGPIFLNVLRVLDVPEALGLLAPRPLTIHTSQPAAFARTASIYGVAGGTLTTQPLP